MTREEIMGRMEWFEGYFQRNISNNLRYEEEFECVKLIGGRLGHGRRLTDEEAAEIVTLHNRSISGVHFSGSGWHDFQLHLMALLNIDGWNATLSPSTGEIRIYADQH